MRILYHYRGPQLQTGSARALVALIERLDRSRFEPFFLAPAGGSLVDGLAARGVTIVPGTAHSVTPRRPLRGVRGVWRQARLLRTLGVDLVHLNEFGWNLDLVLAAWARGIPVVLHVHNPLAVDFQNLHRLAARKVLFVSESHRSAVTHLERIRDKSEVLYNPVDLASFARGRSIRPALRLGSEQVVVGTVAQLRRGKGIDLILELARTLLPEFPDLVFAIVGPVGFGEEAYADEMMRAAADPALGGRVRFLGPRSDVPDVLASFDVFLLPTRAETFGIAVVEAMAAGVPVVASDVGGVGEILAPEGVGWKVVPDSLTGFGDALRAVLRLPDRGRAVGARGRASLAARFDPDTVQRRLEQLYTSLVPDAEVRSGRA